MIKVIKGIIYYSGFEYIYRKIKPAKEPRPLPTLPLWLMGIYVATFGVASQRYENRVDIIENKANTIYAQLASPDPGTKGMAFRRILKIQEMESPYKPDIKDFISIVRSFWKNTKYEGVADLMRETIENWKGSLDNVDLSGFDLKGYGLEESNLQGARLWRVNLSGANLSGANLSAAFLYRAILYRANLRRANLEDAKLYEANLEGADLEGVNLSIEQVSKVETLYNAKLDPELMEQVKEKYPHLLEPPEELKQKPNE